MSKMFGKKVVMAWLLPLAASLFLGGLLLGALSWATSRTDEIAFARQKDLLGLIVANMRDGVAHDQESATVWDDAVRRTAERNQEWIRLNLGEWMNTYFSHDAAVVLSPAAEPLYEHIAASGRAPTPEALRAAYLPLAQALHKRLLAGDTQGTTDKVLSIGESDFAFVAGRPAIISVKPIVSDSGEIALQPGTENMHVAVRFLDEDFPVSIGKDYQFAALHYSPDMPAGQEGAHVPLLSRAGRPIGYFVWFPFTPGASVMQATLPVAAGLALIVLVACHLAAAALMRRSEKLAASRRELQHLALHDPLTGLSNRAHFSAELTARLARAGKQESHAVLFVDLDRFKAVNDTFGHPTGDKLILAVAERLRGLLPQTLIARMGGDEFTLLLEGKNEQAVSASCQRIVRVMRDPFDINGNHVSIGASVGAALSIGPADALEVTRQADIALYHAKAAGRSTYAIFGNHMDELLRSRRELEQDLRIAVQSPTQIETFFQPVYSADGALSSMEALARWQHPQKGYIPPDVFISAAEEIGLVHEIGGLVLESACSLLSEQAGVTVAVNVSPMELDSSSYPLRVLATLSRWNVDPRRLELEITENLVISGSDECERSIETLRHAGVRFAIDDFGTGYSSFSRMQSVKVDRIKIDKSFIDGMESGDNRALVEAMINMAHAKGLAITAEGVETQAQSDALRALGCDNLQGFLLSKPLPRAALRMLLDERVTQSSAA
jgi:diguanylate cyclase (GGDEF)-like protein